MIEIVIARKILEEANVVVPTAVVEVIVTHEDDHHPLRLQFHPLKNCVDSGMK